MDPDRHPAGTRSRTAPRYVAERLPAARSSASSTAISSAAFAIGWPLTGSSSGSTRAAVDVAGREQPRQQVLRG